MAIEDKPFSIRVTGDATGEIWTGDFRTKVRLTRRDVITKDRIRREMLGSAGGAVDTHAADLAMAYSELKVRITDAPKWFVENDCALDLEDETPMAAIYKEAMRVQNEALASKMKDAEEKAKDLKSEAEKDAK